jgi:Domain of unknown function (DUF6379)
MFDKYMICEGDFRNLTHNGQVTGFQFGARLPYYRGLGLSMIEEVGVTIDGQAVARENVRLKLRDRSYTLAEMETVYDQVWEMGEVAQVRVLQPGGLAAGPHRIELVEQLRVSYMPFPVTGRDAKTLTLEA